MKGVVIKTVGNLYTVQLNNKIFKCNYRGKNKLRNNFSNPIVSGDIVEVELIDKETGIIEDIYDRKNYFLKKSLKDNKAHIIAANIDQALIMGSIKSPYTKLKFIDKCIAASFFYGIKPIVLFNKIDLLNKKEEEKLKEISSIYKDLNIKLFTISVKKKTNINEVSKILNNRKTLIIGNSGIGKSSLINFLTGKKSQKTDKLSLKTGRGKQTTTFSEIFKIKNKGTLVDTPGFKDFYFYDIDRNDLKFLYPEFKSENNQCKFNNCNHQNEPGCIIKKNINKSISEKRYNNYLSILNEID
ncbi:MAG: ribosome small subunit-dependent GTPase A [Flammeovirgaceae bacterium]